MQTRVSGKKNGKRSRRKRLNGSAATRRAERDVAKRERSGVKQIPLTALLTRSAVVEVLFDTIKIDSINGLNART